MQTVILGLRACRYIRHVFSFTWTMQSMSVVASTSRNSLLRGTSSLRLTSIILQRVQDNFFRIVIKISPTPRHLTLQPSPVCCRVRRYQTVGRRTNRRNWQTGDIGYASTSNLLFFFTIYLLFTISPFTCLVFSLITHRSISACCWPKSASSTLSPHSLARALSSQLFQYGPLSFCTASCPRLWINLQRLTFRTL
jgi:hypothetical protein